MSISPNKNNKAMNIGTSDPSPDVSDIPGALDNLERNISNLFETINFHTEKIAYFLKVSSVEESKKECSEISKSNISSLNSRIVSSNRNLVEAINLLRALTNLVDL